MGEAFVSVFEDGVVISIGFVEGLLVHVCRCLTVARASHEDKPLSVWLSSIRFVLGRLKTLSCCLLRFL